MEKNGGLFFWRPYYSYCCYLGRHLHHRIHRWASACCTRNRRAYGLGRRHIPTTVRFRQIIDTSVAVHVHRVVTERHRIREHHTQHSAVATSTYDRRKYRVSTDTSICPFVRWRARARPCHTISPRGRDPIQIYAPVSLSQSYVRRKKKFLN